MWRSASICSTALALLLIAAAPAHAGPPPDADEAKAAALPHAKRGLELFDQGHYAEAIAEFERAEKLFHAPTHLKFMAEAHEKLGQLLEAQRRYGEAIADQLPEDAPEAFRRVQTEAREQLTSLVQRIPTLTLEVQGPKREQVQVTANGAPWPNWWQRPRRFNPGEQEIVVQAEGFDAATRAVTLAEGQTEQLVIELTAPAAEPVTEEPGMAPYVPAIVAFGVGGAGLLVGAITGGMSLGKVGELEEICPTKSCPAEDEELADDAKMLGTVSTVGFVVGGVGLAAGVALLLWQPGSNDDEANDAAFRVVPRFGPGAVWLEGTF